MNKNNNIMVFSFVTFIFLIFSCTNKIEKIELYDKKFLFEEDAFYKIYYINSSTKEIEIGIFFPDGILEQDIMLGNLEVKIMLENDITNKILDRENIRISYKDYNERLVNKIYFETIDLLKSEVIKKIEIKVLNNFLLNKKAELMITNLNSSLFFGS